MNIFTEYLKTMSAPEVFRKAFFDYHVNGKKKLLVYETSKTPRKRDDRLKADGKQYGRDEEVAMEHLDLKEFVGWSADITLKYDAFTTALGEPSTKTDKEDPNDVDGDFLYG